MNSFISLFSGGGGADIGAMMAGYTPVAANEYDADIAAVYRENIGDHIRVGDILEQDPCDYPDCDLLHLSPPCPNFSVAKVGRKETRHDMALAEKSAKFISVLSPRAVTVENVGLYRKSESFRIIMQAIEDGGYMYDVAMLNAADYGVPQTRRRLFVRAKRGLLKPMPEPVRWVGWYEAIEDLIPTLPDSQFAPWQLKRLPKDIISFCIPAGGHGDNGGGKYIDASMPHATLRAEQGAYTRAFIMQVQGEGGDGLRYKDEPMQSVTSAHNASKTRAFIVDDQNGAQFKTESERGLTIRTGENPSHTISSTQSRRRILACLSTGRVVAMTPRCLARFQSFHDWYKLPQKPSLACKIIGNAVPPLMYKAVAESIGVQ